MRFCFRFCPEISGYFSPPARYKHLNDGMTPMTVLWPYAPIQAHKLRDQARTEIVEIFTRVMKKRRAEQEAAGTAPEDRPADFLQMLMDSVYVPGWR